MPENIWSVFVCVRKCGLSFYQTCVVHVRCLKNGAADTSRYNGNGFCGKDCEKVD